MNHFDVPVLDANSYTLSIGGAIAYPLSLSLKEIQSGPKLQQVVTMECAGTGRATLSPRPVYAPWFRDDFGTYSWTGTPLAPLLRTVGVTADAVEVLFTGWDVGIDKGIEHAFEKSLPIDQAMQPEVMLAWAHNGQPLLPQHGAPLRLIVPSHYGTYHVKWVRAITLLREPFAGLEVAQAYRYRKTPTDPGVPVTTKRIMSLICPPGVPDLISRERFVAPGQTTVSGVAWSGDSRIASVEFSSDSGASWQPATLTLVSEDPYAWVQWSARRDASPGR